MKKVVVAVILLAWLFGTAETYQRSGQWERVRDEFILEHPACEACGTTEALNVHHIKPYHLYPELELSKDNLITLCRTHHFYIGHDPDGPGPEKPSWKKWNPNVVSDAKRLKNGN